MKINKIVLFSIFLVFSFAYGQNTRLKCSENEDFNTEINDLYNHLNFMVDMEGYNPTINSESYYFLVSGHGEVYYSYAALIIPSKNKTTVYQLSSGGYVVKEIYNEFLRRQTIVNFINESSKGEDDVLPNEIYVFISTKPGESDTCEFIIGSSTGFPLNNGRLLDFKNILE
ncbi:hypothetical protein [uncultured Formosa sp.]|uniref:hypothetical protein n=1 Tax=uncultured Formosa sp. TaxID=255435 RepID=UPI002602BC41|nr:hypothetical protein [uncultured Formosa sp.]